VSLFFIILLTFLAGFGAGYVSRVAHAPGQRFGRMSSVAIRRRAF